MNGIVATAIDVGRQRWQIAKLLPHVGVAVTAAATAVNVTLGLLPIAFIVATSVMLGQVPTAVAGGAGSPAWTSVVVSFVLASAAFAAHQALAPLQAALGDLVARRIDGRLFADVMAAALRSPGIGPLEDQRLLDQLGEASRELEHGFQSPGRAASGLLALIARVLQLLGYVIVVGVAFSWLAAAGLLVGVAAFRHGQRGGLRRYSKIFGELAASRRESRYLRELALRSAAAKELRIFGLLGWVRERYRRSYHAWLMPMWTHRRAALLRPYAWYTAVGLSCVTGVLVAVAIAATGTGGLALVSLVLVLQAVLGAVRLGEFYPEADTQTQFGLNAHAAVRAFEEGVRACQPLAIAEPTAAAMDNPTATIPDQVRSGIRLRDVRFSYPGANRTVFDGLDLDLPAGRCTAIVGGNGAGKTTLVKLLTRLHEPDQGRIDVDGTDIRTVDLDQWRRQVAVIFQDFNRYEVSAKDNIAFGAVNDQAELDDIRRAAADAGILPTLEKLPHGLDTVLAKHVAGGVDLSGGQWQRVALARALFAVRRGASVLILDEPTASLDMRAEARFFDEFVSLTKGVTTLLISHRFSTVRHADNVVVLADGRVFEQGSHSELLALDGRYAEMFRLQARRFADNDADDDDADAADEELAVPT